MCELTSYLLSEGLLSLDQLKVLDIEKSNSNKDVETLITSLGLLTKDILSMAIAKKSTSKTIDLNITKINSSSSLKLNKDFCLKNKLIIFDEDEKYVYVALSKLPELPIKDKIKQIYSKNLKIFITSEQQILEKIEDIFESKKTISHWLEILEQNTEELNESFATKLIYDLLSECVKDNISDIHLEPEEYFVRIRLRKDGVLKQLCIFSKEKWNNICVKIKVLANMDITQHYTSQDGKFNLILFGNQVDFRVSSHPVVYGENIVIRILDHNKNLFNINELGYSQTNINQLTQILNQKNGLFIVTGPTGSGKSTLLFSMLLKLNNEHLSITTIEEPVEYCFPYFRQIDMQVHNNMSFSQAIKSILRQDPDIIALNEIRDNETASSALRAAMTGRMLLTTLHSHSIFGIFDRMEDLGISKKMLIQHLSGIATQRLVRKLCPHCKEISEPTDQERKLIPGIEKVAKAKGCSQCNHTGYCGRIAIAEILHIDPEIKNILLTNDVYDAEKIIYSMNRIQTLSEEMKNRISSLDTSFEEINRIYTL